MQAIILARVSTEEQKEAGNSLPAQILRLEKYCKERGFEVTEKIEFDESAWKMKRARFSEVISSLKKSKQKIVLCCDKIDRLLRSFTKELIILEELRIKDRIELHFTSDNIVLHKESPASDLFRFSIGVSLANYYSNSISDNVKRAYEKLINEGKVIGKAPIGYLNKTTDNGIKTVIVDPERADFIVKIFNMYGSGLYSMEQIAEIVSEEGLRSNTEYKNKLKLRQIESILKNPFYYGFMNFRGKMYPHRYPPIITYEMFRLCKEIRKKRAIGFGKRTEKPIIFKGMIKCARCGCSVTAEFRKNKYVYYHCTNYHKNCEKIYVNQDELLDTVKEVLNNLIIPQEEVIKTVNALKSTEEAKNKFHDIEVKQIRAELNKLEKRQRMMYEDRLDGNITEDFYLKMFEEYDNKKYDLEFKLNQFSEANTENYITAERILKLCRDALELFESSKMEEKRKILNFVFWNLKLDGKNLQYKLKTPLDKVYSANLHHTWGRLWEEFGTLNSFDFKPIEELLLNN
jgi:site-specific DNA recombinase